MFAESVHCQLGVAKGSRKVVSRTQSGYCEWSVAEGVVAAIVWWNAYFFHVRKWRKAYRRVGRDRWRTACVGPTVIFCCEDRRRRRRRWTDLSRDLINEQTQQKRCRWVEISPKAPKICVINVTYSCTFQLTLTIWLHLGLCTLNSC